MSAVDDLIERVEAETGQCIDNNDGDNMAIIALMGAMSRILGLSPPGYTERDDVTAGVLIQQQMALTSENQREQESKEIIAALIGGISPDDIKE